MSLSEIKVVEKGDIKQVFINGVEYRGIKEVSTAVYPGEITEVCVIFYTNRFEIIREEN